MLLIHANISLVIAGGRIERLGDVDARAFDPEVLDARDCVAVPGLIDPHVHLIGGSGEKGFATQTPEVTAFELLRSGITTVVGTLGTDTTTKTMPALLAKAKALREEGLSAHVWTGGYDARALTRSIRDDVILIEEVIGAGELAIADRRGAHFSARELARLAADCFVAGTITGKAGLLHLHAGEGRKRLAILREVLDDFDVEPHVLYPTHVNRNETLMEEAIALSKRGVPVDVDVYEEELGRWVRFFRERGGDLDMLTASSDAAINSPHTLLEQVQRCVRDGVLSRDEAFALVTRNPARILKFRDRGELNPGKRADVLLLDAKTLELRHVVCGGEVVIRDGTPVRRERFLHESNREIRLIGERSGDQEKRGKVPEAR